MTTQILAARSPATVRRSLGRLAPILLPLAALALLALGQRACAADVVDPAFVAQRVAPLGLTPNEGSLREVAPGVIQFVARGAVFHLLGEGRYLVGGTLIELGAEEPKNLTLERILQEHPEGLGHLSIEQDRSTEPAPPGDS